MAPGLFSPLSQRPNGLRRGRLSTSLPSYSSAVHEKLSKQPHLLPWFIIISFPIPGLRSRRFRLPVLNFRRLLHVTTTRFGRKLGLFLLLLAFFVLLSTAFSLIRHFGIHENKWTGPFTGDPPTLVFKREDLQRIWQWEVASGHYPSRKGVPEQLGLQTPPNNPALPPKPHDAAVPSFAGRPASTTRGVGAKRVYLDIQARPPNVAYPPRPVPGSVADLDIVMKHCDFSEKKFVRDCLELLRLGAGLDNGKRVRRGNMEKWRYIYMEQLNGAMPTRIGVDASSHAKHKRGFEDEVDTDHGFTKRRNVEWEIPPVALPPTRQHRPYSTLETRCDPDAPRVFHMFWTGPFTDKPYLALLSFLFTQNTGLNLDEYPADGPCRPKFWLWINPGPAASVPNPSATHDMFQELRSNPWASPFLHPRFRDVIQFKLWNTTEQLDSIPELKDEWRYQASLFNSGGQVISVPAHKQQSIISGNSTTKDGTSDDDMLNRTGSKSSASYDRMSVILSDLARFVLCHRFGGIYLDADTIFLRDWEELWGWKGAFAYRWSRMEKYNTAVLHLNKGSALGTFLFRTALKNGLDFHPMTVSKYTKEAYMDNLLLRLPDALFDSAWLNTEYYQRDRPPQPYFTEFIEFFDTPAIASAAPQVLGFEGFFRGAYSYHFHNFWWKPFDPARNWPDLGPKFINGEKTARAHAAAGAQVPLSQSHHAIPDEDSLEDDREDLDWATVLKRTFEAYIRGEQPNMYGEWLKW